MPLLHTEIRQALSEAAERAQRAPSLLNSQPWRWRVRDDVLELLADRARQIVSVDPQARLLTLSCGAALHHARVALAATGYHATVDRLPDADDQDLLARLRVVGVREPRGVDVAQLRAIRSRRTDRRPFAAIEPVPTEVLARLARAAEAEQAWLYRIRPDQRAFLAKAADDAAAAERQMEDYQADLDEWTHRPRSAGEGVPAETMVAPVSRDVSLRDFAAGRETLLDPGSGDDEFAEFLVVVTAADGPTEWLAAGEATSGAWLAATGSGLVVSVMSDVVEVPHTRALLGRLVDPPGYPHLVLRVGLDMQPQPPAASPRRRSEDAIEYGGTAGP